ncbi:MAG TPA: ribosome-associated translation inhibitor RaiA [Sumerlaeia bacterium]|nr:ribosome-associated translation inhibitor RaiA [Sumerlaeia bacterium]
MSPRIVCHQHTLNNSDREFIVNKVARLRKYYDRISEVSVILDSARKDCQAEILIYAPHCNLHLRNVADNMRTAFEGALNKAERGLVKMKGRLWGDKKSRRRSVTIRRFGPAGVEGLPSLEAEAGGEDSDGIQVEHIVPEPMLLSEARERMVEQNDGMLVFVNRKTEEINILHRNAKDQLELLELGGTTLFQPEAELVALAAER